MDDIKQLQETLNRYRKEKEDAEMRLAELTDFMENAAMPLHWVDHNGIILWANKAELDMLGLTKEEYISFSIRDFHADPNVIEDILTRLGNDETLHNYPAKLKVKDGPVKNVLISSNVLRKDGEFIHTRCFTQDVSSRFEEDEKRTDLLNAFEESEIRLRMAIESTNLGTWDWNLINGSLQWSKECRQIFGVSPGQDLSFDMSMEYVHPDDRADVKEGMQRSIDANDKSYDHTYRIIRANDKATRWIRVQGKVNYDIHSVATRFIGTVLDVTVYKSAEEKSAKLAAIIDSSDDAIISKTLDGIVTSWNNSAERTFGYTEDEMIGQPILKLIPPDRQEEEPHILSRLRNGDRVEHFETIRLTKYGKLIDVSLTISPVRDANGNIIGLSKIAREITEKKQEERRKNTFVAMVSHELKTPLTSITGYLQVLLLAAKKQGDEFSINALNRTQLQARKMIAMIRDFLNLARLEDGKIQIYKEVFELHPLIEEISSDAQFLSPRHTIKLVDCTEIILNADRDKIGQVLMNLLSNAIKYAPNGGNIEIGCETEGDKVKIYVTDEGVGISPSDQKRLFERFYRVNNDLLKTISGFGIGLYLVAEILRYHNSEIKVKSVEGKGSTFYFSLDIYNP